MASKKVKVQGGPKDMVAFSKKQRVTNIMKSGMTNLVTDAKKSLPKKRTGSSKANTKKQK
jgi:hypothetical protein